MLIRLLLKDICADKQAGEENLRLSGLDWILLYPTTLTNGPRMGRSRVGERLVLHGLPCVSRTDGADFMLTQLEDRQYVRAACCELLMGAHAIADTRLIRGAATPQNVGAG